MLDKLAGMETFIRVVECGSFAAAAQACGVSATMVAKQIRGIEDRLGARLLHRTTRRHQLTEVGALYLERCRNALASVALAEASATELQQVPQGQLRVVAPVGFGSHTLAPVLAQWSAAHPEVSVDLTLDDHPEECLADGQELGIVIGQVRDTRLVARALQPYRRILAAAPAYLAWHGVPTHPRDLVQHCCLGISYWPNHDHWHLRGPDNASFAVPPKGRFTANEGSALRHAAVAGAGIVLQPEHSLSDDLALGRLVEVLPGWAFRATPMYLVYTHDPKQTAKLRSAIGWIIDKLGAPNGQAG